MAKPLRKKLGLNGYLEVQRHSFLILFMQKYKIMLITFKRVDYNEKL